MLDIIGAFMEDLGLQFLRLDGSTPVRDRQNLIDRFEKDQSIPIFILSTKAGGLGINLTAADTVILHDLDFNPENDRQAEVRRVPLTSSHPPPLSRIAVIALGRQGTCPFTNSWQRILWMRSSSRLASGSSALQRLCSPTMTPLRLLWRAMVLGRGKEKGRQLEEAEGVRSTRCCRQRSKITSKPRTRLRYMA